MQLLPLIAGVLLLFPLSTYAETIDLVCTDASGFSISIEVHTSQDMVRANGIPARNVLIDSGIINFVLDLEGKEWFHSINRSNGNLTIQAPDKRITSSYKCERAKPKF